MGVPVVDNGGQVQFPGQVQLGGEKVPGVGPVLGGLDPVIIQADLPNGHTFGMAAEGFDLLQIGKGGPLQILRVEAGGEVEEGVLLGQGKALAAAFQIAAGADHPCDPVGGEGGEDLRPVGIEGIIVIMGMGIEKTHGGHLKSAVLSP